MCCRSAPLASQTVSHRKAKGDPLGPPFVIVLDVSSELVTVVLLEEIDHLPFSVDTLEVVDVDGVMDGNLDGFINAFLSGMKNEK